jgi:pimeloyl-ACP methyl ester carboxylesterase
MKGMLMFSPPLMDGLSARMVATARLNTHTLVRGPETGEPVVLVHGNVSAARFFEEVMLALPEHYYVLAPDMRGYGRSERKPVDATRGVRDFSDDLKAFVDALGLERFHLLGWSLGGNVALQYAIDYPADVRTLTLLAPGSPYGFGGSSGLDGTPNNAEYAGSGGGTANPAFVQAIAAGDRSAEQPISPRNVMNAFYFRPPFRSPREDVFVEEMLLTHVDPTHYPGDLTATTAWPGFGPGTTGVNNALSPKYLNQAAFATIDPRPPVLWVRGDADQIVSDQSLFDLGVLGQLGAVPDYPGPEVYPPQPMVGQVRALLDQYAANGGVYTEVVLEECGHSPHIERAEEFLAAFTAFLAGVR